MLVKKCITGTEGLEEPKDEFSGLPKPKNWQEAMEHAREVKGKIHESDSQFKYDFKKYKDRYSSYMKSNGKKPGSPYTKSGVLE